MLSGFKNFILRGNLVELAVAFIMAAAFAAVVTSFVGVIMGVIGKIGGQPDFSAWYPWGVPFGVFVTSLVSFLVISAVVYFFVVQPYTKAKDTFFPAEAPGTPADVALLEEIRDLLRAQQGGSTPPVP